VSVADLYSGLRDPTTRADCQSGRQQIVGPKWMGRDRYYDLDMEVSRFTRIEHVRVGGR
jgi:hypothetical protein